MKMQELSTFIEEQGWTDFGIVSIDQVREFLKKHKKCFDEWVKEGFSADLDYLERMKEDRFNPENKLPDVKTVIVLSAIYSKDTEHRTQGTAENGLIARYAKGQDYHKVLKKKLVQLTSFLNDQFPRPNRHGRAMTNSQFFCSVDSGPMVDRVLAEAAGLGFFGKNSCIIDPSRGSFFFIASVYTSLELEPTPKRHFPNCGNCSKCQKACPTGAIVAPGVVDARKCISYLTIENKEGISEALRSKIGNRLFGCDICQEVCPFNLGRAHQQTVRISAFSGERSVVSLEELLKLKTDEEFVERFAGTPIMRAKRRGILRNACVVAGNSGDIALIPLLEDLANRESDDMIKNHASWAIHQLKKP